MTDLATEAVSILAGERAPYQMDAHLLANLIANESRHNSAWPTATVAEWRAAIETAIKRGLIAVKNQKLAVVVAAKVTETGPTQMEMF